MNDKDSRLLWEAYLTEAEYKDISNIIDWENSMHQSRPEEETDEKSRGVLQILTRDRKPKDMLRIKSEYGETLSDLGLNFQTGDRVKYKWHGGYRCGVIIHVIQGGEEFIDPDLGKGSIRPAIHVGLVNCN